MQVSMSFEDKEVTVSRDVSLYKDGLADFTDLLAHALDSLGLYISSEGKLCRVE